MPLADTCSGWAPAARSDGATIRTRYSPGAVSPANTTSAGLPPTVAVTGALTGNAPENTLSVMNFDGSSVDPTPIMYKSRLWPGYTGRAPRRSVALLPTKVAVPANAAVTKNALASGFGGAYTAGWAALAVMVNGLLLAPLTCTTTSTFPGATPAGTSTLICVGLTYSRAASEPLNVTVAPPRVTGSS